MTGLELARGYWEQFGVAMIREQFPEYEEIAAAALTGSGSECYGFDDEVSRDHDFEPGFCLFIPGEEIVDRRTAFLMERAYAKLPAEYEGFRRQKMNPVGGQRHGVLRLDEYFRDKIGCTPEQMGMEQWLRLPEHVLAEAVNGEVFRDPAGLLTDCREALQRMPEDARRKRLAGSLLLMAQSGQYNYLRCLKHGETGAAQLAVGEYVKNALSVYFLLNRKYMPYYKWSFRALKKLPGGTRTAESLEWLLTTGNEKDTAEEKYFRMEEIAAEVISLLQEQELTRADCGDLEKHAYSVNDGIRDSQTRNLSIFWCVG